MEFYLTLPNASNAKHQHHKNTQQIMEKKQNEEIH